MNKKSLFSVALVAFFCVIPLLLNNCKDEKKPSEVKSVDIKFKKEGTLQLKKSANDSVYRTVDIEIADDEYQRQTGLMYRNTLGQTEGMLFVFDDEMLRSFYMKNTRLPLDIIYIASDSSVVSFQEQAQPFDDSSLPSNMPAQYVLELNAGLVKQWGIEVGDKIDFESISD